MYICLIFSNSLPITHSSPFVPVTRNISLSNIYPTSIDKNLLNQLLKPSRQHIPDGKSFHKRKFILFHLWFLQNSFITLFPSASFNPRLIFQSQPHLNTSGVFTIQINTTLLPVGAIRATYAAVVPLGNSHTLWPRRALRHIKIINNFL